MCRFSVIAYLFDKARAAFAASKDALNFEPPSANEVVSYPAVTPAFLSSLLKAA